jgi:hypothetical protein
VRRRVLHSRAGRVNGGVQMRPLRVLLAFLTVWCLGCDAFDQIVDAARAQPISAVHDGSLAAELVPTLAGVETHDACQCVQGHASECWTPQPSAEPWPGVPDFARDVAALRDAPRDPPLRPPLA